MRKNNHKHKKLLKKWKPEEIKTIVLAILIRKAGGTLTIDLTDAGGLGDVELMLRTSRDGKGVELYLEDQK